MPEPKRVEGLGTEHSAAETGGAKLELPPAHREAKQKMDKFHILDPIADKDDPYGERRVTPDSPRYADLLAKHKGRKDYYGMRLASAMAEEPGQKNGRKIPGDIVRPFLEERRQLQWHQEAKDGQKSQAEHEKAAKDEQDLNLYINLKNSGEENDVLSDTDERLQAMSSKTWAGMLKQRRDEYNNGKVLFEKMMAGINADSGNKEGLLLGRLEKGLEAINKTLTIDADIEKQAGTPFYRDSAKAQVAQHIADARTEAMSLVEIGKLLAMHGKPNTNERFKGLEMMQALGYKPTDLETFSIQREFSNAANSNLVSPEDLEKLTETLASMAKSTNGAPS